MHKGLISILIPTFNRAALLPETLQSIAKQTYASWECIIVDDGSTDQTESIVKPFMSSDSRFKFYKRPDHISKGANPCRNYGFSKSEGEFIQWFDSDDLMHPLHLEKKIEAFSRYPDKDYIICNYKSFLVTFSEENLSAKRNNVIRANLYQDYITGVFSILMLAPLWKRSLFTKYGLFDENIQQSQDLDLYSKIIFENQNMHYIEEPLFYVRNENDSISTEGSKQNYKTDSFLTVRERIINRTPDNKIISTSIIKTILGVMRYQMAMRDYKSSSKCLKFAIKHSEKLSVSDRFKIFRIRCFHTLFKIMGSGDTAFRKLLKL